MDEISSIGESSVFELNNGRISEYTLKPENFGIIAQNLHELESSDLKTSVRYFREIMEGKPGPRLDIVLMNASAAIMVGGLATDLPEGMEIARESVNSGNALKKLEELIEESGKYEA